MLQVLVNRRLAAVIVEGGLGGGETGVLPLLTRLPKLQLFFSGSEMKCALQGLRVLINQPPQLPPGAAATQSPDEMLKQYCGHGCTTMMHMIHTSHHTTLTCTMSDVCTGHGTWACTASPGQLFPAECTESTHVKIRQCQAATNYT